MTSEFGPRLEASLRGVVKELGPDWDYVGGAVDAYGQVGMHFAQVKNREHEVSIRVWWHGAEVRISAVLGVPYEATDELITGSVERVVDVVRALCAGQYARDKGYLLVRVKGRVTRITEWPQYPVELADPWADGL
jgi:hypothetical protein